MSHSREFVVSLNNCNLLQELNYKGENVAQAIDFLVSPIRG